MAKRKFDICTFKPTVKKQIKKDGQLMVRIANILNSSLGGVEAMLKKNSQTMFHICVLEAISSSLGIEISELKTCKNK